MSIESSAFLESLGVAGAPLKTWAAVQRHFEGTEPPAQSLHIQHLATHELMSGLLVLVTDRQGDRAHAGYGAVIQESDQTVVTAAAFGPRFGVEGVQALHALIHWAAERGLVVRETVLSVADFSRVLDEPDQSEMARIIAASNPADPAIYQQEYHF